MTAKPYEKIRSEFLATLQNETIRAIVESNFEARPEFEHQYFEEIRNEPEYFDIYKTWILDQSPFPFPEEDKLQFLRSRILGIPEGARINDGEVGGKIDWPLLYLLIDILLPFIDQHIIEALSYYTLNERDENLEERVMSALVKAAIPALKISSPEDITQLGYPDFITIFLDTFKILFSKEIGSIQATFPIDNREFVKFTESEWLKLYGYTDNFYGFEVLPSLLSEPMLRYLSFPFKNNEYRHLSKTKIYREMMNYLVSLATFKPLPDSRLKTYYRQELCKLFLPLVNSMAKGLSEKNLFNKTTGFEKDEFEKIISDELLKMATEFQFFYATTKNLKNKTLSSFSVHAFPINGQLTKLGHIFSNDEYPFTDYIVKRLGDRVRLYFPRQEYDDHESLNRVIAKSDEGDDLTLEDILSDTDEEDMSLQNPDYDAKDSGGNIIGWKIKTFGRIVERSVDSIRRWDREGLLKPKRYEIYSPVRRQKISYRAYTKEDIEKADKIKIDMANRARHQV